MQIRFWNINKKINSTKLPTADPSMELTFIYIPKSNLHL